MNAGRPAVGSLWRRKPPGKETLRVERVWLYSSPAPDVDPRDDGWCVRAQPIKGGKPLICPVFYLTDNYEATS